MNRSPRSQVLAALRRAQSVERSLAPALAGPRVNYPELADQFEVALAAAHGTLVMATNGLPSAIDCLPICQGSERLCSVVPGVAKVSIAPRDLKRPRDAANVDVAVVPGEFGVAENGAVWVSDRDLPQRSLLFLAEHLVIVLAPLQLASTMHEAYRRLSLGENRFGCFISGPSKTADIEQALVVGAHGPRSLTVVAPSPD